MYMYFGVEGGAPGSGGSDDGGSDEGGREPRACYRYRTPTIVGPWRRRPESALDDAIRVGLAMRSEDKISWRVDGAVEQSLCDHDGACGGVYPEE